MKGTLYISFLACMLLGCSDGDSLPDWKKDKTAHTELEIASVAIVEGSPQTHANIPFTSGSSITLFCYEQAAETDYTPVNNRKYTLNAGGSRWTAESEASTVYLGSEKADVYGYYPYTGEAVDELYRDRTKIPMETRNYDVLKELHYVANQKVDARKYFADMHSKHTYSRLVLNIRMEDAYLAICNIDPVALTNGSLSREVVIDITSGTIGIHLDDTEKRLRGGYNITKGLPYILGGPTKKCQADLLMTPTKLLPDPSKPTKGLSVIVNVSGFPATVIIPINGLSDFESGKKYVVSLKLRGITVKSVIVTTADWDGEVLNEGIDCEPLPQS